MSAETLDTFTLIDDGTLDTVIMCDDCGEQLRFAEVDRDSDGGITRDGWLWLEDAFGDHECICPTCDAGDPTSVIRFEDCECAP